jgi:hypothetical protein
MKKILILSANPKNTSNLRLDEEVREIKKTALFLLGVALLVVQFKQEITTLPT